MRKVKFFSMFLCLVFLMALAGCGDEETAAEKDPLVKTQTITLGNSNAADSYPGTVKGRYETNLSFQVGGQILSRSVQAGSVVQAGEVLMTIDQRDVAQQLNQATAQRVAAQAQLDLARNNLSRYSALYDQEAIAASVLDQYQTAYDAALATYNQAAAAEAQVQNSMGYTSLTAPFGGIISAVNAEAGQVVSAGQTVLTIVQPQELEVEIAVPESRIADITLGTNAELSFWSLNNSTVTGTVREISPMADSITRTYKVRISLPNPPAGLQLGMTATALVASGTVQASTQDTDNTASAALIPLSAIYQTGDTPQVWLVSPDLTLALQPVQVEALDKNNVLVYGLKAGDIVVTAGVHKLREGTKVRLAEDEQ